MRWLQFGCLLLASASTVVAEDWTTADGHLYHNVTVVAQEDDGVRITYDGGLGKIPYYELPINVQKRFGQDVDTLEAKRKAVDQAIADDLRGAAETQVLPPGMIPAPPPAPPPKPVVTASTANPAPTPAAKPPPAPAKPAQPAAPIVAAKPAAPPPIAEPSSPTSIPGVNGAHNKPLELSVAAYSYNDALDVCYLDSPPIDIFTGAAPQLPPGQGSSITLRIITDGRTPQLPDRFEVTIVCVGASGSDPAGAPILFNADSGTFTVQDSDRKDSGTLPGGAQSMRYASFYLSAAQVRQFCVSGQPTMNVGSDVYRITPQGASTLRGYLADIDTLQPATPSMVRSFYKMLAHIPSFFSIISTICEVVIVGSFGLLLIAFLAAFILGITRFIKM